MIGEFLRNKENDWQKASALFRVNCDDYGYAKSCLEYGNTVFTGIKEKNIEGNPVEALKYFEKGCKLNSGDNCLNSGLLLVSPKLEKSPIEQDLSKVRLQIKEFLLSWQKASFYFPCDRNIHIVVI